jgi:hypothetical protein
MTYSSKSGSSRSSRVNELPGKALRPPLARPLVRSETAPAPAGLAKALARYPGRYPKANRPWFLAKRAEKG